MDTPPQRANEEALEHDLILVGLVGVIIIIRPGTEGFDRWSLLGLASVACVVVRDLSTRQLSKAVPSSTVAVLASLAVTVASRAPAR